MTNVDIIKELYRAFSTKDYKAFLATCDTELEWIQNEGFPRGARHIGAQAVVDNVFKAFDNQWERWFGFKQVGIAEDGDIIVQKRINIRE